MARSSGQLTGSQNLRSAKSSESALNSGILVYSIFTHTSDFVQTQNEAKILTSHNIPSTLLQDHQLRLEYLQPKEHHLYSCGGLPHPYRWKDEFTVSVHNTETLVVLNWLSFRKELTILSSLAYAITATNFIDFCLKYPHSWYSEHRLIENISSIQCSCEHI
jgi:hypothetical protein